MSAIKNPDEETPGEAVTSWGGPAPGPPPPPHFVPPPSPLPTPNPNPTQVEPVFVNLLRGPEIDSQPGGPVRQ
jgi:hypothetical protein